MEQVKQDDPTVARIRATMARRGMTQAQMSRYLGVPQGTIGNWLAGTRVPSRSTARLVEVLGTLEALAPAIHDHFLK